MKERTVIREATRGCSIAAISEVIYSVLGDHIVYWNYQKKDTLFSIADRMVV